MTAEITALYRNWVLVVTDDTATGVRLDSDERFECHLRGRPGAGRQPDIVGALRMAKGKIERLEGPEAWIEGYTDEELR